MEVTLPEGGIEVGPRDAPLIIIEFGSFLCPYCQEFQDSVYPVIAREYIKTGKARYRFVSIDSAPGYVRLTASAGCEAEAGLVLALSRAFAVAADIRAGGTVTGQPAIGGDEACIAAATKVRLAELQAIRGLAIRAVPTFLVGAQAPKQGRIVGWVVEGLREPQLFATIRAAHALVTNPVED